MTTIAHATMMLLFRSRSLVTTTRGFLCFVIVEALWILLFMSLNSLIVAADDGSPTSTTDQQQSLTAYPNFRSVCVAFITGYRKSTDGSAKLLPSPGKFTGNCSSGKKPLILGVTHENAINNHTGAANYDADISAYMGDFDYDADIGKWLDLHIFSAESSPRLVLRLDTANFHKKNVTGWPLQYGHMFLGINDQTVATSLSGSIMLEFDIRIESESVRKEDLGFGYNGRRILVGTVGKWQEAAPRKNVTHFLEINLDQTENFSSSYNERKYPLCQDLNYDRCFYSDGRFAEGREIDYNSFFDKPTKHTLAEWRHVAIDISKLFKTLKWVSPPSDWASAQLDALYLAIKSTGASSTTIEFRNYRIYK